MPKRVALVEDEAAIRENYASALRRVGYEVKTYDNRAEALAAFQTRLPDLAILDVCLGDDVEGGFEICRELRAQSKTLPIMFLTALDSDFDTISGLRLGADDYLTKDISLPHMLARVAALLRRVEALKGEEAQDDVIEQGPLSINTDRMTLHWKGQPVEVTLTEFWIVHALAKKPGHVKNRDQLMQDANAIVDDSTVTSHIKRIRKKFLALDAEFDAIDTVYGMGYRWKSHS